MNHAEIYWKQLLEPDQESREMLQTAMWRVIGPLSYAVGRVFNIEALQVETVPLWQIATRTGDPEIETVGVCLKIKDWLRGDALLIIPLADALDLVCVMLGEPPGTITSLGEMERSALAEVGNLLVSSFLSAVVTLIGGSSLLRPSPPGIQVDMLGAILPSVVVPLAAQCDNLQIVEAIFRDSTNTVEIRLWLLPAPADHHVTV